MKQFYAKIRLIDYGPCTLQQLSEIYCRARDDSGEGASTFDPVNVKNFNGNIAGHISYNGRIFKGRRGSWTVRTELLFDNRTPVQP